MGPPACRCSTLPSECQGCQCRTVVYCTVLYSVRGVPVRLLGPGNVNTWWCSWPLSAVDGMDTQARVQALPPSALVQVVRGFSAPPNSPLVISCPEDCSIYEPWLQEGTSTLMAQYQHWVVQEHDCIAVLRNSTLHSVQFWVLMLVGPGDDLSPCFCACAVSTHPLGLLRGGSIHVRVPLQGGTAPASGS